MPARIAPLLLNWYDDHARDLPWRGIHDPYRTWISETMLQQTRVETVIGYYHRFLERFPDVATLAEADEDDVLKMWEGLGYYSRARNLHKGAKQVVSEYGGEIPSTAEALRSISGIGPYTAGAIASIAFDRAVPAVDGNVIRVVSRLKGIRDNVGIPSVRRALESAAASIVPQTRPGDFNQALMDLGSSICCPGTPDCERCPLRSVCDAYEAGDADELPVLPRKNPPKVLDYDLCMIFSGNRILMRQRTETLLKGLWVFPMMEGHESQRKLLTNVRRQLQVEALSIHAAGEAKHVFTHQIWQMKLYRITVAENVQAPVGYRFVPLTEMDSLAIPVAVKVAANAVRKHAKELKLLSD